MKKLAFLLLFCALSSAAQDRSGTENIKVEIVKASGNVYFLDCVDGFGGGNVAASIGEDGVLLVDDMYASMTAKLVAAVKTISDKPVRIVLNTHFHGDHIQGNQNFQKNAVVIAQENVRKRLIANNKESSPTLEMLPTVTYSDRMSVFFNGEEIQMIHYANGHTDGDSVIYFTKSKVLHLGDMFFFEMFPAVYTEGGGDIREMVRTLDKVIANCPTDAKVVPGHGRLATMQDLKNYVAMLKETIAIVDRNIKDGKNAEQMQKDRVLAKYDSLGSGGAQTTDQYIAMLYKLLSADKH